MSEIKIVKGGDGKEKSLVSEELRSFLEEYWGWSQSSCPSPSIDWKQLNTLNRAQWFCNCSSRPIPELQVYNQVPLNRLKPWFTTIHNPKPTEVEPRPRIEKRHALDELLEKKQYGGYRIFPCGHAYLDVALLCAVFDYLNFPYSDSNDTKSSGKEAVRKFVTDKLSGILTKCGICRETGNDNLYAEMTNLDCGTIIRSDHVVNRRLLGVVSTTLQVGDVVDTEGYRGLGLYIYEGLKSGHPVFLKVPRFEYYPIWPLYYLQMRGYRYYLNCYKQFDGLILPNGITICGGYYRQEEEGKITSGHDKLVFLKTVSNKTLAAAAFYSKPGRKPNCKHATDEFSDQWDAGKVDFQDPVLPLGHDDVLRKKNDGHFYFEYA